MTQVKDCPCADESKVPCDNDRIHFNVSTSWPTLSGFKKYLQKPANEIFNDTSFLPPDSATEILIACGMVNGTGQFYTLAASMKPEDLFDPGYYSYNRDTNAKLTKSFYTYYSKYDTKVFGLSGEQKIRLEFDDRLNSVYDLYDYRNSEQKDHHRLTVITNANGEGKRVSLARCGPKTYADSYDIRDGHISLFMFYK